MRYAVNCSLPIAAHALALALLLGRPAAAQSYASAVLDGVAARDRALETNDQRDWQRAAEHFDGARQIESTKETEFEFAEAAVRIGRWVEAYAAYVAALELGLSGKAEARARAFVNARAAEVAQIDLQGPAGARVFVGDRAAGELPLRRPLMVVAGECTLRVERPGFHGWSKQLAVPGATLARVEVELEPEPVAEAMLAAAEESGPGTRTTMDPAVFHETPASGEVDSWSTPLLVAGSSLLGVSVLGLLTTTLLLPDARRDLDGLCLEFDASQCVAAARDERDAAQSAADRVVTLENLRWVAASGALVGLAGATVGFVQIISREGPQGAQRGSLRASATGISVEWQATF